MKHEKTAAVPKAVEAVFGSRADIAQHYAHLLGTDGVERGLIGPRERDRLWDRHILNSAAIAELIPVDARVADIGSGAGLPGIPLAIARPDLRLVLIEPLLRRATFLSEVVETLGLDAVTVFHGRAEAPAARREHGGLDAVASRAVAALDKLTGWSVPLLRPGGEMLAIKGDRVDSELTECRHAMASFGVSDVRVMKCGVEYLNPPTTVVVGRRGDWRTRRTDSTGKGRAR